MIQKQNIKRKKQYEKAITLIALVITIIVLLILAGVTISTLMGENDLQWPTKQLFKMKLHQ